MFRGRRWNLALPGLLVSLFFISPNVLALDPGRSLFQYNCQTWKRQNGLPANGVNAITQTKDGYLWLGTVVGLVRFDGSEFQLLDMSQQKQLRSSIVTGLSPSAAGGLWFGLERSAFGYCDGTTFSFRSSEGSGGISQNVHAVVEMEDGSVWVAAETRSGKRTQSNGYETYPGIENYDVTTVCRGSQGRVWLGTTQKGLYSLQNGTLAKFPDPALDERIIRSLLEDRRGRIWVGTELGLLCYEADGRKLPLPYPWYEVRALVLDRHGAVWVGTSGGGVARYLDDQRTQFRQSDGLADDFVTALAEDREGSLWIGTRNGLSQFSDLKIPTFGKTEGLTADVNISVSPGRQGGLWVASSQGFTWFGGGPTNYVTYLNSIGLRNQYIKQVYEASNGDIYLINGSMDIEVFSGGKVVARYPNQTWPSAFAEDSQGVIVAAGDIYRVGTNYFAPYTFTNRERPALSWVFNMTAGRDGTIWVASSDGLVRIKGGAYTLYAARDGLVDSKVICVCEDDEGVIWVGMEAGIARLKNGKIRHISRENGLFDNLIYNIVPDDYGALWVAAGRGFFRVSRQSLNDFADGKTDHVDCVGYDGLESVKTFERNQQDPSGCKTRDGRIWFPTAQGVVMIDPTNITANTVPPPVYVHLIRANGRELEKKGAAVVRPGQGELEFHYAGLSYIAPQKIQYRYKLEGYDKDWVQAGTRRSAFYTNLKPGRYNFQVRACNADGVWGAAGASFSVELLPHFYQSGWFMIACGFLTILVLFGIYAWRVSRLRWKERKLQEAHDLLEAKVKERTAELARSNQSLVGEIEERKRMESEVERVHRQLVDASRMAGQAEVASSVLHNVGNVLNSVNVSTTLIAERLKKLRLANLAKAVQLIIDHSNDLARFLGSDQKGIRLPKYLQELAEHLGAERGEILTELNGLSQNVEHIKEIVAMQQTYAKVSGVVEKVGVGELVDGAITMQSAAYLRHTIKIQRDYEEVPTIVVDRHKVLQILINIFQNAKLACDEGAKPEKLVDVRVNRRGPDRVAIQISDNGVGIIPENLTRIFSHGFTTRKQGHGFGLHASALAAKEMGGALTAHSEGAGKGATFTLELPFSPAGQGVPATPRRSAEPVQN